MPSVTKQTNSKPKPIKRGGGVLDRIAPVSGREKPFKIALYGKSGTGKTRLACTFPKPLLIVGTEDGTDSVSTDKEVYFVRIERSEELKVLLPTLSDYPTVVLDTASMLQDLILAEILGIDKLPEQKSWGMASRDQYGQCAIQTKEYLRAFLNLSSHVVIVAQERDFNENANSDVLAPSIGPGLMPSVTGWLNPACDYVCQTFIRGRTEQRETKIAGKSVKTTVKVAGAVFCLRTAPHETYMTKFRLPRGTELPEEIVDPDFSQINKLIRGK